jgi:ClpP class serine protease
MQMLANDLKAAINDPSVDAILVEMDSPGGELSGVSEFAQMLYDARAIKPVVCYVSYLGASAGYWIASAANSIHIGNTASVGSIGVISNVYKNNDSDSIAIVSTQSPYKMLDPTKDKERAKIQARADKLAGVFIDEVAKYRGISPEKILKDFGQGDVLVGSDAVSAGMADSVTTFEKLFSDLRQSIKNGDKMFMGNRETTESNLKTDVTISEKEQETTTMTPEEIQAMIVKQTAEAQAKNDAKFNEQMEALKKERVELNKMRFSALLEQQKVTPGQAELLASICDSLGDNAEGQVALQKLAAEFPKHGLLEEAVATDPENKLAAKAKGFEFDLASVPDNQLPIPYVQDQYANHLIKQAKEKGETLEYRDAIMNAENSEEFKAFVSKVQTMSKISIG